MDWTFFVTMEDRPRVQSRLMHVFDKQLIAPHVFQSVRLGEQVFLRIRCNPGHCDGVRLKALILELEDVREVCASSDDSARLQERLLLQVAYDDADRRPLLEVLSAVGAEILSWHRRGVVFELRSDVDNVVRACGQLGKFWKIDKIEGVRDELETC